MLSCHVTALPPVGRCGCLAAECADFFAPEAVAARAAVVETTEAVDRLQSAGETMMTAVEEDGTIAGC